MQSSLISTILTSLILLPLISGAPAPQISKPSEPIPSATQVTGVPDTGPTGGPMSFSPTQGDAPTATAAIPSTPLPLTQAQQGEPSATAGIIPATDVTAAAGSVGGAATGVVEAPGGVG